MKLSTPRRAWLLLAAALLSLPAHAETWRVDLIVFRFLGAAEEQGLPPRAPVIGDAIELDDVARLRAAGITVLPEAAFGLADHWNRLKGSPQFKPLMKLAWTQIDPPSDRGPRLHLKGGALMNLRDATGAHELAEFDGTVSLLLNRYLHLDADLLYTQGGDTPQSWALDERRRMRSEELNHLDSPRLGIVVKVSKAGG